MDIGLFYYEMRMSWIPGIARIETKLRRLLILNLFLLYQVVSLRAPSAHGIKL
jgi:hypothetical protein